MSKLKIVNEAKPMSKTVEDYIARKKAEQFNQLKSPTERLLINVSPINEKGEKAPQNIGTFHVVGTNLYNDTVEFRPLVVTNKLMRLAQTKTREGKEIWATMNETIFFNSYSDTIYDKKGGIACGKVFGTEKEKLNKEQLQANTEKAKSFMFIFGRVKFPEEDKYRLVDFRVGGKRIMEASNAFNTRTIGKGNLISEYLYEMTLTANSKGVHPDLHITPDLSTKLNIEDIIADDEAIMAYIEEHNKRIMETHKKYVNQAENSLTDEEETSLIIGDDE